MGQLEFGILKALKTGKFLMLLLDSSKSPISCTTISPALEIKVKQNVYISFFDNSEKYWFVYATEEQLKKIIETLKNLNATIQIISDTEQSLPNSTQQTMQDIVSNPQPLLETDSQADRESNTDSSDIRKTKLSILNRMANMGHSVLPPNKSAADKTSDSSDTNESNDYSKTVTLRHKNLKGNLKKHNLDKTKEETGLVDQHKITRIDTNIENVPPLYTFVEEQLVPVASTNITMGSSSTTNDMNTFMSEQRVSCTELRINMNRMAEKIDQVFSKISDITHTDINNIPSPFYNEILQKLLNEYESKIKTYEEIIKSHGTDNSVITKLRQESSKLHQDEIESLNKKISEVLSINEEKDSEIFNLKSEIKVFKENSTRAAELEAVNFKLSQENQSLRKELNYKNEEKQILKNDPKYTLDENSINVDRNHFVKNILSHTFHAISANFHNSENYSGETVKNIVANVIKSEFQNLKQDH
ncbi:leucine-rich repeat and coiled-coil domain-containing protein PF3D7_0703800 [Amyelois transitella]|uniref:leucine-rich repeat and coiled-coil domain-containing protein PF3D7_0703800 n=1 Tax=Amyelois transitella TaxID=680683 RepID=UPI00298FCA81|nr:leucine-rich repeat and coiled-coil domain-containing protein PF3D7_0703800 [Amyelois transitella]